jgi:hypothetical protein
MIGGAVVRLLLLGAAGCASHHAPAAAKPPRPATSVASRAATPPPTVVPAAAPACRGERVVSATDRPDWALERLAAAVLGPKPPPVAAEAVEICRAWPRGPAGTNPRSNDTRIFDVKHVTTTGSPGGLTLALVSSDALEALLTDSTAHWQVVLLDGEYHRLAQTSFSTERPAEMTLDGVGARLQLEHGLIHAQVAFGCADKNGERFDVPIQLSPSCLHAEAAPFPGESYQALPAPAPVCAAQPLGPAAARGLPSYESTQGKTGPWLAMPYIADDVAALDTDWLRVAMLLSPRAAEPSRREPSASVAVGSPTHATPRWTYIRSAELRLHQLLPVRNARGSEAYLALYARSAPDELVRDPRGQWHVALLSPSYALLSDVTLGTAAPPGHYFAIQSELELAAGQVTCSVEYLKSASGTAIASTSSNATVFRHGLRVNVDSGCVALEAP